MTTIQYHLPLTGFALALLALACDAQTTPDYPGRTLLTVSGNVTGAIPDKQIVPALAFKKLDPDMHFMSEKIYLLNVDVQGQFPSEFTLRMFDAPPAESLASGTPSGIWGPPITSASIVTVTADHPASIVNPIRAVLESMDASGNHVRETTFHATFSGYDTGSDDDVVYREIQTCDGNGQNCTTTTSGDPLAASPIDRYLRGVVSNYQVLYSAGSVPDHTVPGWLLGPLSAGYHLVNVRIATQEEVAAAGTCRETATTQALATFSARHGTSNTVSDAYQTDAVEWQNDWIDAVVSLACPRNGDDVVTVVPSGVSHPVTMDLVNDRSQLEHSPLDGF